MHMKRIVEYAHACYYLQFAVISNTSYRVEEKKDDFESDTSKHY